MGKKRITFKDIVIGVLFSIFLLSLWGYMASSKGYVPMPNFPLLEYLTNPYVFFGSFIALVIIMAFSSVLSTANVHGLHIHSFFKKKTQGKPQD